jgi:hypothetical protein
MEINMAYNQNLKQEIFSIKLREQIRLNMIKNSHLI